MLGERHLVFYQRQLATSAVDCELIDCAKFIHAESRRLYCSVVLFELLDATGANQRRSYSRLTKDPAKCELGEALASGRSYGV